MDHSMRRPTFDLDVLRTFVTGVELNSFAKAADRLGRSTSAVSAQLKKLEEQVGTPVLSKSGRGLVLTPVGEALLGHARRLLDLNDTVFSSLNETQTAGTLRLGLQEDFGEHVLSDILRRFARLYPMISLEVRIGRNAELLTLIDSTSLDLALTWETGQTSSCRTRLGQTPMHWIGPRDNPGKDIGARGYVDLTLDCMRAFGAQVDIVDESTWRVAPTGYTAHDYLIEPDASAATYLWAAEVLTGGRIDLGVAPQDFTQPDAKAQAVIAQFPQMQPVVIGSQMQDAIPTLAVLAAFNNTPVRFTELANLRVKECDRVQALHDGLNEIRPGLATIEGDDLLVASDPALAGTTCNALIDTHADHRIAMCFALAGLKVSGIRIQDPDCVGKTYPEYWKELESLGVHLTY